MTGRRKTLVLATVLAGAVGLSFGHGVSAQHVDGGIGVRVAYDGGAPVAFADVRVFAPGETERPVLTGQTDRNGCFLFLPDAVGAWRIIVDDGMGHAVTHEIAFDGQGVSPVAGPTGMPRSHAVLTGLATIFGLFGWTAFVRLRKAAVRFVSVCVCEFVSL